VDGLVEFVTGNDDFYRIDTALTVPRLSAAGWTLRLHGMVDRELTLGFDEIVAMPSVERLITMTCVSNQVGGDLVGTATWQGVRLADLLDRVGVDPAATQVVGRAFDGWTAGFPVEVVADNEPLVVYGMNGQPLPEAHGFPLRLVTPGLYGYVSATKWLTEVELTTFEDLDQYWVQRGWADRGPIKVQSRIDTPAGFDRLPPVPVAVAGVAWAQTRGIEAVEVRVDDGDFAPADLAEPVGTDTWRQWVFRWDTTTVQPGRHQLTVRATDGSGTVQTEERTAPFPSGATGWHSIAVFVDES
jgi:sulfite oxidase